MRLFFLLSALAIFTSCEKIWMAETPGSKPNDVFEALWSGIDENYSLFEYSKVNWDSIKVVYRSKINNQMNEQALYDTLSLMLFELKDAHTSIFYGNPAVNTRFYNYCDTHLYASNYNFNIIKNNYLMNPSTVVVHGHYAYCLLNGSQIGYMLFNGYFDEHTRESDFINMLNYFGPTQGLIIDLRENTGGSDDIARMMLSHFTSKKRLVSKSKCKNGTKHNQFSNWQNQYIEPAKPFYNKPIVILTNRKIYSTSNEMVLWARTFENITLIGAKTGGGIGIPAMHLLPNGWFYRVSSQITATPDDSCFFDGIEPHIRVTADYQNQNDDIIDAAVNFLN